MKTSVVGRELTPVTLGTGGCEVHEGLGLSQVLSPLLTGYAPLACLLSVTSVTPHFPRCLLLPLLQAPTCYIFVAGWCPALYRGRLGKASFLSLPKSVVCDASSACPLSHTAFYHPQRFLWHFYSKWQVA